jgi:hypothetical protein
MKKIAVFTLILIFTCGQAFAVTLTVALFDLSGSVLTDNTGSEGKDAPYNKNMSELKKEINKLGKGDTLIIIGFGRKSDVTLLKASMPRQAGPGNQNLIATRQAAVKKLEENMATKAKSVDNARTDIIGSLFRASRIIEEYEGPASPDKQAKRLLIYSDMLDNENAGLSFNRLKDGSYKGFLKGLENKKMGYPNLKDIEVNIYSAFSDIKGISTVETEVAIKNLKSFWSDYLSKCGSNVKSYRTNY